MRTQLLAAALAAVLMSCLGSDARAVITLDISSVPGASIDFTGTGTGASFDLTNSTVTGYTGSSFDITGEQNGTGDSLGLQGTLGGSYSYSTSSITSSNGTEVAPLTTSPTTGGVLTITDAKGVSLTGDVQGVSIQTSGTGGAVNVGGTINLTNVTYTGTNSDLTALKNQATAFGGIAALSFTISSSQDLYSLAGSGANFSTSYAGALTAAPEPTTMALASLGALGFLGYGMRRRKARTA